VARFSRISGEASSPRPPRPCAARGCTRAAFLREARILDARRTVIVAYFLVFLGIGVFLPYFPLWLRHLGFDGWQIGAVMGTQPLLRWVGAIALAWAADHWRLRRRLLTITAAVGTVFFVPLLVLEDFTGVLLASSAIAFFYGPVIPMLDAFVIGALASAPLVEAFSPAIVPNLLLAASLGLAPALSRLPSEQVGLAFRAGPPWRLLTPPLAAFLAAAFLLQVSSGAWTGFFAVHTAALGLPASVPGLTWGLAVIAEIGLFFWGRRLGDRIAPTTLIVVVLGATVVRWALTAVVRTAPLVIAVQLGHAITFSAFHLAAVLLLLRLVPPERSTSGQALYGAVAFGVGGSAGLALAGVLVDRVGTAGVFAVDAVCASLALAPALRLRRLVGATRA
jgi:PPP family 3-phenylpropionic acid transporter